MFIGALHREAGSRNCKREPEATFLTTHHGNPCQEAAFTQRPDTTLE
jgi:hypothetical protein